MLRRRPPSFKHRRRPRSPSPTRTPIPLLEELKSTAEPNAVLVEMQVEGGCEPNAAAYRMMADGACRAGDFEMASRVMTAMLASGNCPREETFRCLMNGLSAIGKVEAACSVLEEMARRKMELDGNGRKALVEATLKQ